MGETDPTLQGKAISGSMILLCFAARDVAGGVSELHLLACSLFLTAVLAAAGTPLTTRAGQRVKPRYHVVGSIAGSNRCQSRSAARRLAIKRIACVIEFLQTDP